MYDVARFLLNTTFAVTNSDQVMQNYQNSAVGSRQFKLHLVELVAIVIHEIAVLLFQSDDKLHSKEHIHSVVSWKREPEYEGEGSRRRLVFRYLDPHPTLFYHVEYLDHDQYPSGLADIAGYWAEDRILGGVVVFDRGVSGDEVRCPSLPLTEA